MSNKPPNDAEGADAGSQRTENQTQIPYPISISELNQLKPTIDEYIASNKEQDRREKIRFRLEVLGFFLVIVGAFLAGINIYLLKVGLNTSRQAADAASRATQITQEQVHAGQRAYLIVEKFHLQSKLAAGEPIRIQFDVRNTGQTPALNIAGSLFIDVLSNGPTRLKYLFDDPRGDLGAGQSAPWVAGRLNPFTAQEIADISTEEVTFTEDGDQQFVTLPNRPRLVIYGKIKYSDVFGRSDYTEFCASYFAKSVQEAIGTEFGHCAVNNHIN